MSAKQTARTGRDRFAADLLAWYDTHGRKDLPWQHPRTPYRVWLSEVMLQQTQVRTVIPYFERFVAALPDLASIAHASQDQVLALWSGLGYYSRARNLQRAAQQCVELHQGELPRDPAALAALPGIGRSTAAAILALAFGERHAILDGNVRRVLARWHGVHGWPGSSAVQNRLWQLADAHTPQARVSDYTQAIMDLGATLCLRTRPHCDRCPLAAGCIARTHGLIDVLPQARPARSKPVREIALAIARDGDGRILFERRPPVGVWASLWSLPEAADARAALTLLHERFHVQCRASASLPSFRHSFTHYHLQVTPLLVEVDRSGHAADRADLAWHAAHELAHVGLPAPVRRLIASLEHKP